ncbi:hypothetical protein ACOSQ2_015196 [Xanthoceras sorbifolium]
MPGFRFPNFLVHHVSTILKFSWIELNSYSVVIRRRFRFQSSAWRIADHLPRAIILTRYALSTNLLAFESLGIFCRVVGLRNVCGFQPLDSSVHAWYMECM